MDWKILVLSMDDKLCSVYQPVLGSGQHILSWAQELWQ